jgi:putative endonuclease
MFQKSTSWFVYIVRCADETLYVGISQSVADRVRDHNAGIGSLHTRTHGKVELLWSEEQKDLFSARKREAQIKGWTRRKNSPSPPGISHSSSASKPSFFHVSFTTL